MIHRRAVLPKYPIIGTPTKDPGTPEYVVTITRAPNDVITKRFPGREEAREAVRSWRNAIGILFPRRGAAIVGPLPEVTAPRTKKDLSELLSRTIAMSQAGEIPISAVQPIVQLAKLQMKLLDMKDPEDDLTGLSEGEILDRIFEQLTTEELLDLARERLDLRRMEVAA